MDFTTNTKIRRWSDLPGPKGVPLLGNALQLKEDLFHLQFEEWAKTYGPQCGFKLGTIPVFLIADANLSHKALKMRPGAFRRMSKIEQVFREFDGHNVFSSEGEEWRAQRRVAARTLALKSLRGYYPVIHDVAKRLLTHWNRACDRGTSIDIQGDLLRYTIDVTTTLAFGRDVNTIDGGADILQDKIATIFPVLVNRVKSVIPYWRWFRLPQDRKFDRALQELREWMSTTIGNRRSELSEDPEAIHGNFLDSMLSSPDHKGGSFDENLVLSNALFMLMAGEDTTANTIAWAIHHLCDAPPAYAQRIREEADRVLGSAPLVMTLADSDELLYAGAVANETLRLRPVAPFVMMEATEDVIVENLDVRKGEVILSLFRPPAMHADTTHAPTQFLPDRWLTEDIASINKLNAAFMPFGAGPRICPGKALSLLSMRVVISMLYKNFDVHRIGRSADVSEVFRWTMAPVGLNVRLTRRADASLS